MNIFVRFQIDRQYTVHITSEIEAVEAWVPRRSEQGIEVRSSLQTILSDTRCLLYSKAKVFDHKVELQRILV
jgi:hypothetical protein